MKNGLELEAPVTREIGIATALVIKAAALCLVLYGAAQFFNAIRWW